jgi:hypothetical protein
LPRARLGQGKGGRGELARYETRFAKIESDLTVLKWMMGVQIAGVVSLVIKAFA